MRELILKMSISVDGFVGTSDGGIRWVFESRSAEEMDRG
jgi:riboflavin biosynthesis pyrimidine reductase